jgi:GntR family transcriptional regulator
MNLDKESFVPLYYQLADLLRESFTKGELKPGEHIPSENELMKKYNISRGTIREAMRLLIKEGLIKRIKGVGTFVVPPKIEHETNGITSFSRVMLESGIRPSAEVLKLEYLPAPFHIAQALQLRPGEDVVLVKRLRFANAERLMIERSYYRKEIGQDLFNEDLTQSIYTMWQEKYHYKLSRSEKTLEVKTVSTKDSKLLEIPKNSPVVVLRRLVYFGEEYPIEYAEDTYRSDRTVFKFKTGSTTPESLKVEQFY